MLLTICCSLAIVQARLESLLQICCVGSLEIE